MSEDNAPKEMNKAEKLPEDEEIIELTDEVSNAPDIEEEIIDLTDPFDEPAVDASEEAGMEDLVIDEIPSFEESVEDPGAEEQPAETVAQEDLDDLRFGDALDEEIDAEGEVDDDFVNSLGMDLEEDEAESESSGAKALDAGQVEAAIERVLMKILPEKIEAILVKTIEDTVKKEIDKIKGALLDE